MAKLKLMIFMPLIILAALISIGGAFILWLCFMLIDPKAELYVA